MKNFKKTLAILLTLLMVLGSMSTLMVSVSALETFKVTYQYNDGKTEDYVDDVTADGKSCSIPPIDPTRTNYVFKNWAVGSENGAQFDADSISKKYVTKDTVYVAVWQIEKYTVVFDFNGGTAVIDSSTKTSYTATKTAGDTITAPATPTLTGYEFGGWAKSIGGEAVELGTAEGDEETISFWAIWNPVGTGTTVGAYTLSADESTLTIDAEGSSLTVDVPTTFGVDETDSSTVKLTKANITKIIFKSGNYTVPDETFKGYTSLTTVTGSDYISSLGESAFEGCTNLKSIDLSGCVSVASAEAAFKGDVSLQSITFDDDITVIPESICEGCTGLVRIQGSEYKDINFPTEVIEIGDNAFNGCTSIEGLVFGTKLTTIGDEAFAGCTALQTIDLKNVDTLGESAFEGCTGLNTIKTGAVETIGAKAFKDCSGITSLDLSAIQVVGENAFENCTALEEVDFGDDIYQISNYAFFNCPALTSVYFNKGTHPAVGVYCLGYTSKTSKVSDFEIICDRDKDIDERASAAAGSKSIYTYAVDNDFYTSYFSYLWASYSPYMTSFGTFFAKFIPSIFSVFSEMFESMRTALSSFVSE